MNIKAFKVNTEQGKPDLLFIEVNDLGTIHYNAEGQANAWYVGGDTNTEVSLLVGQHLKRVTDLNDFKKFI